MPKIFRSINETNKVISDGAWDQNQDAGRKGAWTGIDLQLIIVLLLDEREAPSVSCHG